MFDSFRKLFSKSSRQEEKTHQMELIDEEIDEFEREIQEYISYTEQPASNAPPEIQQPSDLAKGGAISGSSLITPEAKKRIENS